MGPWKIARYCPACCGFAHELERLCLCLSSEVYSRDSHAALPKDALRPCACSILLPGGQMEPAFGLAALMCSSTACKRCWRLHNSLSVDCWRLSIRVATRMVSRHAILAYASCRSHASAAAHCTSLMSETQHV